MKSFNVTSMLVMLMFLCITGIQAQSVTPSKKYITKDLNNVGNFTSIRVLGSPDVEYRQSSGSKTTVSIYGSDNLSRPVGSVCCKRSVAGEYKEGR